MLASLIKKGLLIAVVLLYCASATYAQAVSGKTVNTTTVSPTNNVNSDHSITLVNATYSSLGYKGCKAKALFEQALNTSMSEEEFRSKCKSIPSNKQEWIKVRNYFQRDIGVDLTEIESIIAAFDAKM